MLRMISDSATSASSLSKAFICADLIRSRVCWLKDVNGQTLAG